MNGDDNADIVGFGQAGVYVSLSEGNGQFAAPQLVLNAFGTGALAGYWTSYDLDPRALGDVNGDTRADIIGFGQAGVYESVSEFPPPALAAAHLLAT